MLPTQDSDAEYDKKMPCRHHRLQGIFYLGSACCSVALTSLNDPMNMFAGQRIMNAAIRTENEILLAGAFKESFGLALNVRFAAGIEKGAGAMIKTTHQRGAWLKEGAGFFKRINFFHVHIPVYSLIREIVP